MELRQLTLVMILTLVMWASVKLEPVGVGYLAYPTADLKLCKLPDLRWELMA